MKDDFSKNIEISKNNAEHPTLSDTFNPDKRIEYQTNNVDYNRHTFNPENRLERKPFADGLYTTLEDRIKCTNIDASEGGLRGSWDGERGNSLFRPAYEYMKNALKEYGVEGIRFHNGIVDFVPVAEATVKIGEMTAERYGKGKNFDQANTKLAEKFNEMRKNGRTDWNAEKVEEYRISQKLTWHERPDCETMDLVPKKIHDYFNHSGGVAECKVRDGLRGNFDE